MDGAAARMYRRAGVWYLVPLLVALAAFLAFFFTSLVLYLVCIRYLKVPFHRFVGLDAVGVIGVMIGTAIADALIFRASRPTLRWVRGEKTEANASAAWLSTVRMPSLHFSLAPIPIVLGAIPALAAVLGVLHPAWYYDAALVVASLTFVALAICIHMVGTGAILRPVVAEIDELYPQPSRMTKEASSLRPRIVVSSVLTVMLSAWMASALVTGPTGALQRIVLTFGAGLVVAAVFGSILAAALSQSLFGPITALTNATRRVRSGDLSTRLPLVSDDELGELTESFNEMVRGLAEREALRSAFGAYVDPGVADRLLREGHVLKAEQVDVTIMFVDIVGFSARAEMMQADLVCDQLNEFFSIVIPRVEESGGHVNKLMGDGLMAVFGTPMKLDDHADRALDAACAVQSHLDERYRGSLSAGVGLHSGRVVVGTMGGGSKLDFTLVGDAVNVAARVESLTRRTGDGILITEATKDALQRSEVVLASRGTETVRGRSEPVSLYAVVSRVPG